MAVTTNDDDGATTSRDRFKNILAWAVFVLSVLSIWLVTWLYSGKNGDLDKAFSVLVPLFSTWVGTILAFYFARENFDTANASVQKLVEKLSPDQQFAATSVQQVMKKRSAIRSLTLGPGEDATTSISKLKGLLGNGASRLPVFDPNGVLKYMIHDSTLTRFIADRAVSAPPLDLDQLMLPTLLAHVIGGEPALKICQRNAFVKIDATIADARTAMLALKGAQDVFVTQTGKADAPVEGWLTNLDITREI